MFLFAVRDLAQSFDGREIFKGVDFIADILRYHEPIKLIGLEKKIFPFSPCGLMNTNK